MKFTKTLIAATLLATGGLAQASVFGITNATTGSDAVLTLVDTANKSYFAVDLGITYASLAANPSQLSADQVTGGNFTTFITNAGSDAIQWKLEAGYNYKTGTPTYITTLETDVTAAALQAQLVTTDLATAITNLGNSFNGYNGSAAGSNSITVANNGAGYSTAYSVNDQGPLNNWSNSVAVGTALNLFETQQTGKTTVVSTEILAGLTFNVNGSTGTFTTASTAPAVPLPTTAWMFLSGVIGMLSLKRKNSSV